MKLKKTSSQFSSCLFSNSSPSDGAAQLTSATPPSSRLQQTKNVSSVYKQIILYPEAKMNKGKHMASKDSIPSHLTSNQFIQLSGEKKSKKQEEVD